MKSCIWIKSEIEEDAFIMKKTTGYIVTSILNFTAGLCFLLASTYQEQIFPKYGFLVAAACLLISAVGFLYTYLKNIREK